MLSFLPAFTLGIWNSAFWVAKKHEMVVPSQIHSECPPPSNWSPVPLCQVYMSAWAAFAGWVSVAFSFTKLSVVPHKLSSIDGTLLLRQTLGVNGDRAAFRRLIFHLAFRQTPICSSPVCLFPFLLILHSGHPHYPEFPETRYITLRCTTAGKPPLLPYYPSQLTRAGFLLTLPLFLQIPSPTMFVFLTLVLNLRSNLIFLASINITYLHVIIKISL